MQVDVRRGSFQLYIFLHLSKYAINTANKPSLDVSLAFSVGWLWPQTSACVWTLAMLHRGRKRDEKSNPASHTADIRRRDKRHTTRQTMKNWNGFSIKQWYWLNWPTSNCLHRGLAEAGSGPETRKSWDEPDCRKCFNRNLHLPTVAKAEVREAKFHVKITNRTPTSPKQVFPKYLEVL